MFVNKIENMYKHYVGGAGVTWRVVMVTHFLSGSIIREERKRMFFIFVLGEPLVTWFFSSLLLVCETATRI